MKHKYLSYIALAVAGAFVTTGCTDDFAKINTDPVAYGAGNYEPAYLLTTAQLNYTGSPDNAYETWRSNLIYASTMMQQLAAVTSYWAGDKYLLNTGYAGAYWERAYTEQLKFAIELIQLTKDKEEHKNLYQAGRLMRAMILGRITDMYGDMPYFDAGLGYYTQKYFLAYDTQDKVYGDLLKEIEEATVALDDSAGKIEGDLFYGGEIGQWRKFGYTLLLRTAMRLTKVEPETAKAYVAKAVGKTFESNADNAVVVHDPSGSWTTQNRNSVVLLKGPENVQVKLSKTYVDFMKSNNDPRLAVIAVTNPTYAEDGTALGGNANPASQKGLPNGFDIDGQNPLPDAIGGYSSLSPSLLSLAGPTFVLTYAESELLLADAAQRWSVGGNAEEHYNAGTKAGITYFEKYPGVGDLDAAADDYVAAHPYDAANGLKQINTQFWAATLLNGYEAWINWRRSGFPELTPVNYPGNATNGTIPRRFPYPLTEANNNPVNYKVAHDAVRGGDLLTGRVWWDTEN
ncbi:SusD/RagB family nutrient-binding outer membrane lipoprotein [Parachryseolinea silvisoli]|uniref:SusD/RagB family nutrient-binding outer membrane lipoprotein n=1 Tax=Parachryseolinea silvisoli TaxID=2873601 RepID=UPI002265A5F5|nr:SusD/RagB family nutrient-binding outer membrane lipoprotein [Parachryseolinea silvisoli]MCD9019418.1 SusD/RagB family nutrient-binding outer membrane lipoprotein [Parachryseolinea silvisoli]